VENAFITVHRPTTPNGASVVICPGGGYGGLVTDLEGHGIASSIRLSAWAKQPTAVPKKIYEELTRHPSPSFSLKMKNK